MYAIATDPRTITRGQGFGFSLPKIWVVTEGHVLLSITCVGTLWC
jgi:hypothetical protein